MVNYNNGKIYKIEPICDHDEGDIYIGSTTKDYLSKRMVAHRNQYNNYKHNGKSRFVTSYILFDKYGLENCKITLLELVNVNSSDELRAREGYYIQTFKCVNKLTAGRTRKDSNKIYYQMNKEEINEKQSKIFVCGCGSKCRENYKQRHYRTKKHLDFSQSY